MRIFKLLRNASGVDFTFYKKPTIRRRVARRMALKNMERLSEYLKDLQSNREELDALYQDLLIQVTSFFRDPDVFRVLRNRILPRILAGKPAGDSVRIWVPGCASGEEAYSIAICLLENLGDRAASTPIQIFASDISEPAIDKARAGVYSSDAMKKVSKERVRRFFDRVNGNYQIKSGVRDLCIFARHDLTRDPPFSRMDLISCRNVLIYLEPVLQKRILASFRYALQDGGFLLLGKSETLAGFPDFRIADRKNKFFAKVAGAAGAAGAGAREARPASLQKPTRHGEALHRGSARLRPGEGGRPHYMGALPACRARGEWRSRNPALPRGHESVSPAPAGKSHIPASPDGSGGARSRAARGCQ